ncbi:MAG: hypothetical protein QM499_00860 [Flavobacteriaceae bacterium]
MEYNIKDFVANKSLASFRVTQWIGVYTKKEVAEILKMSRPTLDFKLKNHSWRVEEIKIIIKNFVF